MKKRALVIILFILAFPALVSSLEIQTEKEDFRQGETFFATLQGNILEPVQKQNVGFYEGHVQIPLTFDILKIQEIYYISALLPYSEKNLSIKIQDVYYKEQNKVQKNNLEKNFTIFNELADFNVEPGAFLTKSNLTLNLYNNLDEDITLSYAIENLTRTTALPLQKSKELKINISDFPPRELSFLTIASDSGFSYNIPVYSMMDKPEQAEAINQTEINQTTNLDKLSFLLLEINETLNKGSQITRMLSLTNIGNKNSENIELIISSEIVDFVSLSASQIELIMPNETIEIEFTALFPDKGNFSGFLLAESEGSFDKIDLNFYIGENITPSSTTSSKKTCAQLGGKKCIICDGTIQTASDGICCLGTCSEEIIEQPKKTNWTAIIVIAVALAIIGVVIFLKLRKPKPSAEDILERRKKSYSEKYNFKELPEKQGTKSKEEEI